MPSCATRCLARARYLRPSLSYGRVAAAASTRLPRTIHVAAAASTHLPRTIHVAAAASTRFVKGRPARANRHPLAEGDVDTIVAEVLRPLHLVGMFQELYGRRDLADDHAKVDEAVRDLAFGGRDVAREEDGLPQPPPGDVARDRPHQLPERRQSLQPQIRRRPGVRASKLRLVSTFESSGIHAVVDDDVEVRRRRLAVRAVRAEARRRRVEDLRDGLGFNRLVLLEFEETARIFETAVARPLRLAPRARAREVPARVRGRFILASERGSAALPKSRSLPSSPTPAERTRPPSPLLAGP